MLPRTRDLAHSALDAGSAPHFHCDSHFHTQMTLIDGKAIAARINDQSRIAVAALTARGHTPGLAVVLVGADPASQAPCAARTRCAANSGCIP